MNLLRFICCAGLLLVCVSRATAQDQDQLAIISRATADSIQLRWAPSSAPLWAALRQTGLVITRRTMRRDGKLLPVDQRTTVTVTPEPLFPVPEQAFIDLALTDDYVAIGGQVLYGDSFTPRTLDGSDEQAAAMFLNAGTETENRFSFGLFAADQSWTAARMLALGFTDRNTIVGETYLYRIRPGSGEVIILDTIQSAFVGVEARNDPPPPVIRDLVAEWRDKQAVLRFSYEVASNYYSSYYVERSTDGITWVRDNELPFVPMAATENAPPLAYYDAELPDNNRPYLFRVGGRTPFGTDGPPSFPTSGIGKDPIPSTAPSIISGRADDQGSITVEWYFPKEDSIKGFQLLRSPDAYGPFEPITDTLGSEIRYAMDELPLRSNYYQVKVYDAYDRELTSFAKRVEPTDSIPPITPRNFRGVILEDGQVILSWTPNEEEDLIGYRVWYGNSPTAEFSLATGGLINNPYYIDSTTLNTLTRNFYAQITALDFNYNPSPFSEIIALVRPDTIPPSQPLLFNPENTKESMLITFDQSETPDVARHELFRRPLGDTTWTLIQTYSYPEQASIDRYLETETPAGKPYEYRIDAIDLSDLRSTSETVQAQRIDDFIREPIKRIEGRADRREKTIVLEWPYKTEQANLDHFEIYRGKEDDDILMVAKLPARLLDPDTKRPRFIYTDTGPLRMDTEYRYRIRAVFSDGGSSPLSKEATVRY